MEALSAETRAALVLSAALGGHTRLLGQGLRKWHAPSRLLHHLVRTTLTGGQLRDAERQADAALRRVEELGGHALVWGSPSYPKQLRQLIDPPPIVFAIGRLALLNRGAVAVVGTREATPYGRRISRWLARELGRRSVTVVSGLARGIDAAAHEAALDTVGSSIAVLGTGLDVAYPRSNARLASDLRASGLVLTEFLPGTPAMRHHFPRRNRLVAALSSAVIVVEAGSKSGSFITVDHALDLGKPVFGVPGSVDSPVSRGVHDLLRQGATVVSGLDDLFRDLEGNLELALDGAERSLAPGTVPDGAAGLVWKALSTPATADEISVRTALAVQTVAVALTELELAGTVERGFDGRYARMEVLP